MAEIDGSAVHGSSERPAVEFVEGYDAALRQVTVERIQQAETITAEHEAGLGQLLGEDYTDEKLEATLQGTATRVENLLEQTYDDVDTLLADAHEDIVRKLPFDEAQLVGIIKRRIRSFRAGSSQEVKQLSTDDFTSEEIALTQMVFNYPLWQLAQEHAGQLGLDHTEVGRAMGAASGPATPEAMQAALEYEWWRGLYTRASSLSLARSARQINTDGIAVPEIRAAVHAGLDYPFFQGVRKRGVWLYATSVDDRLEFATPLLQEVVRNSLEREREAAQSHDASDDSRAYEEERPPRTPPPRASAQDLRDSLNALRDRPGLARLGHLLEIAQLLGIGPGYNTRLRDRYVESGGDLSMLFEDDLAPEEPREPDLSSSDPYEVLGVDIDACSQEIQAAYRQLARIHHTDVGGSKQAMQIINGAYDTLKDTDKRAYYDEHGHLKGYE